ncbi:MAG: hypothetical protein ACOX7R_08850 [Acetivibrionales bacterium]|jgi:metal-dependent hydrolase (beta-lactamase superfamily II)
MIIKVLVENTSISKDLGSEHGLSLYIGTNSRKILFDVGASELFLENAKKINDSLETINRISKYLMDTKAKYYTCHCTGIEPYNRLKAVMGDSINYLSAGSEITI